VRLLGAPGEFLDQRRLAAARFARHEHHPALAGQPQVQKATQLRQLTLPGNKDRSFNLNQLFIEERGRFGCEIGRTGGS
jgi:hypothetical protein